MDRTDRRILHALQQDATLSLAQLADRVGLSQTPCWKRVQRLEKAGVLLGRVALVRPEALGLGLTVFVAVTAADHAAAWRERFAAVVSAMPEVMDIYRMAGDTDYQLRVVLPDMAAYDAFYRRLTEAVALKSVSPRFAIERIKATTAYPVDTETP